MAEKSGSTACPFNYLYWDFLDRNAAKLRSNPRMGLIYKNFQRMSEEKLAAIRDDSTNFFQKLDINEKI